MVAQEEVSLYIEVLTGKFLGPENVSNTLDGSQCGHRQDSAAAAQDGAAAQGGEVRHDWVEL